MPVKLFAVKDCICLNFLHCGFSNVSSYCVQFRMHSCIGCISLIFLHYVFSNVSSNVLPLWMHNHMYVLHLFDFSPPCKKMKRVCQLLVYSIPLMQLLLLLPLIMKMAHKVIFAMTETSCNNTHPLIYVSGKVSALIQQLQNHCKWDKGDDRFHGSLTKLWGMNQRRFNYIRVHSDRQRLFQIKSCANPTCGQSP